MLMSKMKISDRAKIFAPYDALKGFKEMLKQQEQTTEEKKILSEEQMLEINNIIINLQPGMVIRVKYYNHINSRYEFLEGVFVKLDSVYKKICIVKTKINIIDIIELKIIDECLF